MNLKLVFSQIGKLLMLIGFSMSLPMILALIDKESDAGDFLIGMIVTGGVGFALYYFNRTKAVMYIRDGFALVTFGWLFAAFFGAIPMFMSGAYATFLDAFFETLSGFTATGITVAADVEALPNSILLWRSLTQWLGGLGIVVLFVALLSNLGTGGMHLFKAEITGPVKEKIRPRITDSAKSLWLIYLTLTILNIVALRLCGMDTFDAVNHGMATIATGGFSTKNSSLAYFNSPLIEWVTIAFMFVAGLSFAMVFRAIDKRDRRILTKNSEVRLYVGLILIMSTLLCMDIYFTEGYAIADAIRLALFNVVGLVTTTGYIVCDFELWSSFAKTLLILLMFTGACAGSTSGGIKLERILILVKQTKNELQRILHPRLVTSLKINESALHNRIITNVSIYVFLYLSIIAFSTVVATLMGLPMMEAFSSSVTCLGNGGPAFGYLGPTESFSALPNALKVFDCVLMLIGRLEIYTVLVVIIPLGHKTARRELK